MATKNKNAVAGKFEKGQIMGSVNFAGHRDLLMALLEEEKTYSIEEVCKMIQDELDREVN